MFKPLPIGIEFFEEFKRNDYYYVDKTLFIKELIDKTFSPGQGALGRR